MRQIYASFLNPHAFEQTESSICFNSHQGVYAKSKKLRHAAFLGLIWLRHVSGAHRCLCSGTAAARASWGWLQHSSMPAGATAQLVPGRIRYFHLPLYVVLCMSWLCAAAFFRRAAGACFDLQIAMLQLRTGYRLLSTVSTYDPV